jgi:putative sterol carrier protein
MELGSREWLTSIRDAINGSEAFAQSGRGWSQPLGLRFVGEGEDLPTRCLVLDLRAGRCEDARLVDDAAFDDVEYALSAPYDRWAKVLAHDLDLMRCIVLNRVQLRGDRITALRFVPAAKALLDACSSVDASVPTR